MKQFFILTLLFFCTLPVGLVAQSDSTAYTMYEDKVVLYTDLGYSAAPFSIHYPLYTVNELKYKNNFRGILGLGLCYKWFSGRIGLPLPVLARPVSRYGKTTNYDIGFDFSLQKLFFDVDLRTYKGYAIKDAYLFEDSLNELKPNFIRPNVGVGSFSMNMYYFHNKDFRMSAIRGKIGHYNKSVITWYLKSTFNIFGAGDDYNSLIPNSLKEPSNHYTTFNSITAADVGLVPGVAFVNRINNFQYAFMGGAGVVGQGQFHTVSGTTYVEAGFLKRYDFKITFGYNRPDRFLLFVSDFDAKSIRMQSLLYRQWFYNIKLVAGIRLK